jgi:hypothetical protein
MYNIHHHNVKVKRKIKKNANKKAAAGFIPQQLSI